MALFSKTKLRDYLQNFLFTILGIIQILVFFVFTLLLLPTVIYRYLLTKWIAPYAYPELGKCVSGLGHFMAAELLPTDSNSTVNPHPRCLLVANWYLPGILELDELAQLIKSGWLTIKPGETCLRYPEFQQFLTYYGGYMFWKQDLDFSLLNHLQAHRIPDNATEQESDTIYRNYLESLVNKPLPANRSPWEIHLLQNYKNSSLQVPGANNENGAITVISLRIHHSMVDGFSIMFATIEGLLGHKLPSIQMAKPVNKNKGLTFKQRFHKYVYVPWRFLRDAGYIAYFPTKIATSPRLPWRVSDKNKKWMQIFDQTEMFDVETLKLIKQEFGVSFTAVLISCLGAAAAENFKKRGFSGATSLPFGTVVPLPGHPNKLRNHLLVTLLEVDVRPNLDPVERLLSTEEKFIDARHNSQLPKLLYLPNILFAIQPAKLSRYLLKNRFMTTGISNFPGPGKELDFLGRNTLYTDFCAGMLPGFSGVGFMAMSYCNKLRVNVMAEQAVMDRDELSELVESIEREVRTLYQRALVQAVERDAEKNTCIDINTV